MANITLRNKTLTIDDALYTEMKERLFDFDEDDCKDFLTTVLTTGNIDTGFTCPNIDKIIETTSESQLSIWIEQGARLQREVMA